jgi:hypothetical protein
MSSKETLQKPWVIFIIYVIVGSLFILIFRMIFPGEVSPLPVFSRNWSLIRGLIEILALFPALVFSALVVPFGIVSEDEYFTRFSPRLFQRLMPPLFTAFAASGLYAILFFLVLPMAQSYEENLYFKGETYRLAKGRAQVHAEAGEWLEASQLIGICDVVWQNSPELTMLREEIEVQLEEMRFMENRRIIGTASGERPNSANVSAMPGQKEPLHAADAIAMGETALGEGRLFDAHWLAIVGSRIAKAGSPEKIEADRLAARAWNRIESLQPTIDERRVSSLYQIKMSGYEAMVSGDWIRAFYIFKELVRQSPTDPDAVNFLAASEKGTREVAFFIDAMDLSPGESLTNVLFSLPVIQGKQGRSVMRIASLSARPDYAYGLGIEYMMFDSNAQLLLSFDAPYAKILPIMIDGQQQVLIMMRALSSHDSTLRWEPEWNIYGEIPYYPDSAQITLDIDYETFLDLSEMRQRLPSMPINELFDISKTAGEMGYITQVYEAEILNRLGTCLFFLPMAVFIIIIGWCFRARQRPRYFFVLLLPILPLIFNGMAYLYRIILNTVGISLIFSLGFSIALPLFIAILVLVFIISLVTLAAQRG